MGSHSLAFSFPGEHSKNSIFRNVQGAGVSQVMSRPSWTCGKFSNTQNYKKWWPPLFQRRVRKHRRVWKMPWKQKTCCFGFCECQWDVASGSYARFEWGGRQLSEMSDNWVSFAGVPVRGGAALLVRLGRLHEGAAAAVRGRRRCRHVVLRSREVQVTWCQDAHARTHRQLRQPQVLPNVAEEFPGTSPVLSEPVAEAHATRSCAVIGQL